MCEELDMKAFDEKMIDKKSKIIYNLHYVTKCLKFQKK